MNTTAKRIDYFWIVEEIGFAVVYKFTPGALGLRAIFSMEIERDGMAIAAQIMRQRLAEGEVANIPTPAWLRELVERMKFPIGATVWERIRER